MLTKNLKYTYYCEISDKWIENEYSYQKENNEYGEVPTVDSMERAHEDVVIDLVDYTERCFNSLKNRQINSIKFLEYDDEDYYGIPCYLKITFKVTKDMDEDEAIKIIHTSLFDKAEFCRYNGFEIPITFFQRDCSEKAYYSIGCKERINEAEED